jgi:Ni,Fe-hydrogenase III small subunit
LRDGPATERAAPVADVTTQALAMQLDGVARAKLGRSLAIRHVDAGSCNGCELETHALNNIVYDLERFGLRFVASPRHADVLLVTGPLSRNMREALKVPGCPPTPAAVLTALRTLIEINAT